MVTLGNNDSGGYLRKQYNPTAPDWSLAPSADIPEFLPQAHSITPNNIVSKFFACALTVFLSILSL